MRFAVKPFDCRQRALTHRERDAIRRQFFVSAAFLRNYILPRAALLKMAARHQFRHSNADVKVA